MESMGYEVGGYWTEIQCDSEKYRVPRLVMHFLPVHESEAEAASSIGSVDAESTSAEIRCTILNEVRKQPGGSFYLVPRLKMTVQLREGKSPDRQ